MLSHHSVSKIKFYSWISDKILRLGHSYRELNFLDSLLLKVNSQL